MSLEGLDHSLAATRVIVDNCLADESGGGIYAPGGAKLSYCNINNNSAMGKFGQGGGIWVNTTLKVDHSTFDSNSAVEGGGIWFYSSSGDIKIEKSTISNNDTEGIYTSADPRSGNSNVMIDRSTISGNGGIGVVVKDLKSTSTATFNFSRIADNNDGIVFDAVSAVSKGPTYNLYGTVVVDHASHGIDVIGGGPYVLNVESSAINDVISGGFINGTNSKNNITAFTSLLGALAENGGSTKTHYPQSGSPLIDTAGTMGDAEDQREYLRPYNTNHDIGSVERQAQVSAVTSYTINGGAAQRSRVTTITINFAFPVDAAQLNALGGIRLVQTADINGTGAVGRIILSTTNGLVTSITLTFNNANGANSTDGVEFGSLTDGRWRLEVPLAAFATSNTAIHRLFGDINGDATVDGGTDFSIFGTTFGLLSGHPLFQTAFDFNNDDTIDGGVDFAQFGVRFGASL